MATDDERKRRISQILHHEIQQAEDEVFSRLSKEFSDEEIHLALMFETRDFAEDWLEWVGDG